jgi:hypothetical protein
LGRGRVAVVTVMAKVALGSVKGKEKAMRLHDSKKV